MNFEEWFDFYYGKNPRISSDTIMDSQIAWTGCKEEVLKILKDSLENDNMDRLEEEIKKL